MSVVWTRFWRRPRNRVGLALAAVLLGVALCADFITGDPYAIPPLADVEGSLPLGPGGEHVLGTDNAGRDTLARLIHGTRASLGIALAAAALQVSIGLLLGVLAGYFGGAVDVAVTKTAEVLLSFPLLLLLLAVQGEQQRKEIGRAHV